MRLAFAVLASSTLLTVAACAGPGRPADGHAAATAASPPLPTRGIGCRPVSAHGCNAAACEDASEGLHAEAFDFDVELKTVGACLYTDCYAGPAQVVREPGAPWNVTLFGVVHSERPEDGVTPPGSAPFPLTVVVDLRDGHFIALWSVTPDGLQIDFGTCALQGP